VVVLVVAVASTIVGAGCAFAGLSVLTTAGSEGGKILLNMLLRMLMDNS
jgi:hypothetical protein